MFLSKCGGKISSIASLSFRNFLHKEIPSFAYYVLFFFLYSGYCIHNSYKPIYMGIRCFTTQAVNLDNSKVLSNRKSTNGKELHELDLSNAKERKQ